MQPNRTDIIVIGGGVIGVSIAYYSALNGASVLVIDRNQIGSGGSSSGNAGLLVPSHCNPLPNPGVIAKGIKCLLDPEGPFYIRMRSNKDLAGWLWKFYRCCNEKHLYHCVGIFRKLGSESIQLHQELAAAGGDKYQFSQNGILKLFLSEKAFEEAQEDAGGVKSCGAGSKILTGEEVRDLEPAAGSQVVGGMLSSIDGSIDPGCFVKWLARESEKIGVRFLSDTEAFWLTTDRRKVNGVMTTRGELSADQVVLASGAWLPLLVSQLGVKIPLQAAKGYSLTYRAPHHGPRLPMLLEEARVAVTPLKETLRLSGTLELSGLDLTINRKRLKAIATQTYHFLPKLGKLDIKEVWRGLRPCTPDGLPVMGRLHPWSNVYVAGGHATKGMSLAPATGKYLSKILAGESIGMLERSLRPNRF
jgi:D-amino-acid dehydrogenase